MTVQIINPETISAPLGAYSQAILTTGQGRTLNISGQIGIREDGRVAGGFAEQADAAWKNIVEILGAADMDVSNLIKIVTYLTDPADAARLAEIRSKYLGNNRPASTMVVVKSLLKSDWLIEIEATAFKLGRPG
ncbi:RidA family protein [Noviherbaspirillum sp.]|uniref:RidA family protein n=1 Tax=Noviherbaspirillum sp. TaxID=1926288 RepID=UPI002D429887|nr:RidA family protein [Noviherbaspirillum sp.]HZW23342.1 RidA family protein [Noviherbaspirillum sp.]